MRRALTTAPAALLLAGVAALAANQAAPAKGGDGAAGDGKQLFVAGTTPSCATCHAFKDAAAVGGVGPDLDALQPDAARVRNAVRNGFEAMPAFGHVLSDAQIDALARYVERAAAR
jgi:mono/diheme cytochrome c family protein